MQLRREPLYNSFLKSFWNLIPGLHLFLQNNISVVKLPQITIVLVLKKLLLLMSNSDQTQGCPVGISEDIDLCLQLHHFLLQSIHVDLHESLAQARVLKLVLDNFIVI